MPAPDKPLRFSKLYDGCYIATHRDHLYRIIRTYKGDWYAHVFAPGSDFSNFKQRFDDLGAAKRRLQEFASTEEFA